jgi:hypothetical protein
MKTNWPASVSVQGRLYVEQRGFQQSSKGLQSKNVYVGLTFSRYI